MKSSVAYKNSVAYSSISSNGGWDREGQRVSGVYLTGDLVVGTVQSSRVKYGGVVQHTVLLDQPKEIMGSVRETLALNEDDLFIDFSI
jgi:predicted RNA-binding protein